MTSDRRLQLEIQAVAILRELVKELTDDEVAVRDTVDGETDLIGAIHAVFKDLQDDEILVSGIDTAIDGLASRKNRLENRIERRRKVIGRAMEVGELKSITLPEATLSLRNTPQGLDVKDESVIPPRFFKPQPPKLDRKALKDALAGGVHILGASLTNGGQTLSVRRS